MRTFSRAPIIRSPIALAIVGFAHSAVNAITIENFSIAFTKLGKSGEAIAFYLLKKHGKADHMNSMGVMLIAMLDMAYIAYQIIGLTDIIDK